MSGAEIAAIVLGCSAMAEDLRRGVIPNWLAAGGVAAGLVCGWWSGGVQGAGVALAGTLAGFAVFLALHWMGGLGGGDVKLMAAFGALLGPKGILGAALWAAVAGGLLALALLWWRPRRASIPYAPAIVIGAWLVLLGRK
jgi:prepilin peptidase CpaA